MESSLENGPWDFLLIQLGIDWKRVSADTQLMLVLGWLIFIEFLS